MSFVLRGIFRVYTISVTFTALERSGIRRVPENSTPFVTTVTFQRRSQCFAQR